MSKQTATTSIRLEVSTQTETLFLCGAITFSFFRYKQRKPQIAHSKTVCSPAQVDRQMRCEAGPIAKLPPVTENRRIRMRLKGLQAPSLLSQQKLRRKLGLLRGKQLVVELTEMARKFELTIFQPWWSSCLCDLSNQISLRSLQNSGEFRLFSDVSSKEWRFLSRNISGVLGARRGRKALRPGTAEWIMGGRKFFSRGKLFSQKIQLLRRL